MKNVRFSYSFVTGNRILYILKFTKLVEKLNLFVFGKSFKSMTCCWALLDGNCTKPTSLCRMSSIKQNAIWNGEWNLCSQTGIRLGFVPAIDSVQRFLCTWQVRAQYELLDKYSRSHIFDSCRLTKLHRKWVRKFGFLSGTVKYSCFTSNLPYAVIIFSKPSRSINMHVFVHFTIYIALQFQ